MSDIDWDDFVTFELFRNKLCRKLCKEGFNFDFVEEVLFGTWLNKVKNGTSFTEKSLYNDVKKRLKDMKNVVYKGKGWTLKRNLRNAISFERYILSKKNFNTTLVTHETPFDVLHKKECIELLKDHVAKLHKNEKVVFDAMLYGEDTASVAKKLRISCSAVNAHVHSLLNKLRLYVRFCQLAEWKCANFPKIELSGHGNHS